MLITVASRTSEDFSYNNTVMYLWKQKHRSVFISQPPEFLRILPIIMQPCKHTRLATESQQCVDADIILGPAKEQKKTEKQREKKLLLNEMMTL